MKNKILLVFGILLLVGIIFSEIVSAQTLVANCQADGVLTIPRYKNFQSMNNPNELWVLSPGGSGNLARSHDGGVTWQPEFDVGWYVNYHSSVSGDLNDNLYIADRQNNTHVHFTKINSPGNSASNLIFGQSVAGPAPGTVQTPNVLAQDSNNIWLFLRTNVDASGNVYYRRSTNGGQTFGSAQWVANTGYENVRIGSLLIEGQPAVVIWYSDDSSNEGWGYRYYIWDPALSQFVAKPDYNIIWDPKVYRREYSMSYVNGEFHVVFPDRSGNLIDRWKTYNNGVGTWNQVNIESIGYDSRDWGPSLTKHGNDLYVFYVISQSTSLSLNNIYYKKWDSQTQSWGSRVAITNENNGVGWPHGPAVANPSSTFIPVIWSLNSQVWYEAIPATSAPCVDSDNDGYNVTAGGSCGIDADCDDTNININPDATEICGNAIDEDCSGADLSCSADVNFDGNINVIDLAIVIFNQGRNPATIGYGHLDLNSDGIISWSDVSIVMNNM